jgi:hypothetical protein
MQQLNEEKIRQLQIDLGNLQGVRGEKQNL